MATSKNRHRMSACTKPLLSVWLSVGAGVGVGCTENASVMESSALPTPERVPPAKAAPARQEAMTDPSSASAGTSALPTPPRVPPAAASSPSAASAGAAGQAQAVSVVATAASAGSAPVATQAGRAAPPPAAVGGGMAPPLTAAGSESSLRELLGMDWEVPAGREKYVCLRASVADTAYFHRLHPALAAGTHHMGLMVSQSEGAPNGESECSITETGERMVVSGGPGTQDLELPEGVAIRIDKGEQFLLQLHLFNFGDSVLRGHSGVDALTVDAGSVRHEAELVASQVIALNVPHGKSVARGRCTFDRNQTLLGLLPHMHGTGRHVKVTLHTSAGDRVLHDADFEFAEQRRYALEPVDVAPGDYMDYECSYENTSDRTRVWGESSNDEMCMVGSLRYPGSKQATPITCLF